MKLVLGLHNISVVYDGDYYYTGASAVGNVTVKDKLNSTVVIGDATLVIGEEITFNATVNNEVLGSGNITVNGVANATVNVTAGTYIVVATFAGNSTHKAANATRVFSINKTAVTVTIDTPTWTIGDEYIFTGKVNDVTTNLTFIINGVRNATIANVSAGTYLVTAIFEGNFTHEAGIGVHYR